MVQGLRTREHKAFRAIIVGLRQGKGWRQVDMAKALGWHRSVVGKIEQGERTCSIWEFMQICRALGERPSKVMQRIERW